jgi:hypothetical protein
MKAIRCAAAALLAAGCVGIGDTHTTQTLSYDFNSVRLGWEIGAADYPESQATAVGAFGAVQPLPAPLATSQFALYFRGTNVSDDLFLFQKRRFGGLSPGVSYTASMQLEFATSYQAGCTTGPGPLTLLKAGLSSVEPLTEVDAQGIVRMTIDKGAGAAGGDFLQLGDIRNGLTGCSPPGTFGLRLTQLKTQPTSVISGPDGGFWVFIGTQSSFIGQHEIYITGMKLVLE